MQFGGGGGTQPAKLVSSSNNNSWDRPANNVREILFDILKFLTKY